MKLTHARITNFRSIEDSGEFSVDQVTCMVGKNESGKTALLTALYRLNPYLPEHGTFDKERDYPRRFLMDYESRHPDEEADVIVTRWKLDSTDRQRVLELLGPSAERLDEVTIFKAYGSEAVWQLDLDEVAVVQHCVSSASLHQEEQEQLSEVKTLVALKAALEALGSQQSERHKTLKQRIDALFPNGDLHAAAERALPLPKFLLFSQYQRMQGQVALEALIQRKNANQLTEDDRVLLALCEMVGTTVENVSSITQFESLIAKFEAASNKISSEIFRYWTQNRFLKVHFRLDPAQSGDPPPFNTGRILRTRIENQLHQVSVPFDDRSTGFVWFFSFLVLFSQVKKSHGDNVLLLLDEPGLSLHAKAQSDLLRYFKEQLAPHHQVIYTTHSPFMVPPDNLMSVRTVEDHVVHKAGEQPQVFGTKVGDKVLSTDRDTLFPLQGALGYEITQTLFIGENTLLVEGPSDLLYLKAFSTELVARNRKGLDPRWTVCPTGGIDKVSAFMSLFGGNHLHVAVFADFASGQKKKVDDLRRSEVLKQGHVLTADAYAGQSEADVEDLLGASTYIALVNASYGLTGSQTISAPTSATRIVKAVEDQFRVLGTGVPDFDHFAPSSYLLEHRTTMFSQLPDIEAALGRFEKLFADLNGLLPAR